MLTSAYCLYLDIFLLFRRLTPIINVADLPGTSDEQFLSWLEEQLLAERASAPKQEAGAKVLEREDSIIDILWCYGEQLSRPGHLFPCCAILTRDKVVLERLVIPADSSAPSNIPGLQPCSIVPICNIQQMVLGPCYAFFRLEEAFVGKPGTYTIFGVEPQGLKRFIGKMFEVCQDLDVSNTPDCTDLSVQSDLLKEIVAWEEENLSIASDRLAAVILMKELGAKSYSFLVLSENQVYCLDTAFVHWPPASFEASPEAAIIFKILHTFSITNKISNIKTHPLPCAEEDSHSIPQSEVPYADYKEIQFVQYQLDLQVTLSEESSPVAERSSSPMQPLSVGNFAKSDPNQQHQHCSNVNYFFSSAAYRDLFLDRLTNLRAEQAHRMSPNVREEPEGGNELQPQTNTCGPKSQPSGPQTSLQKEATSISNQTKFYEGIQSSTEEDALSTGSAQTGVSEDNTIYYSASPSDNLSVSPMSNFSRASISPPTLNQQGGGGQNVISHVVRVEATAGTASQCKETDAQVSGFPASKADQASPQQPLLNSRPPLANPEPSARLVSTLSISNSIPSKLSDHGQQDFNIAFEQLKRPGMDTATLGEESELDQHLRRCIRSYNLLVSLPVKLKPLYLMGGRDLRAFFKTILADVRDTAVDDGGDWSHYFGVEGDRAAGGRKEEELRHVLWTCVVPYTNPKHEIVSLVMVSTKGIYLVSDTSPAPLHKSRPSWMTHTRNQSDSVFAWQSTSKVAAPADTAPMFSPPRMPTDFASCRADGSATSVASSNTNKAVKSYFRFSYEDLHKIDVGVFDQCVRLTGSCADSVFTLAVRDSAATEQLVQYLKDMLTLFYSSKVSSPLTPEGDQSDAYLLSSWETDDFYREDCQRTKSTLEGIVYTHPSKVKFVYPGEDSIKDILYLVDQSSRRPCKAEVKSLSVGTPSSSGQPAHPNSSLWLFILCHQLLGEPQEDQMPASQPRSVIITPSHFSLSQEDIVTYPLPDFVRGLPENPCHQIMECRPIEALKRIRLYRSNTHWLALTFVDEAEDFVVDTSIEHFSQAMSSKERQGLSPEVTLYLFIDSPQEKDKLVQLLSKIWKQLVTQVGLILDVAHV